MLRAWLLIWCHSGNCSVWQPGSNRFQLSGICCFSSFRPAYKAILFKHTKATSAWPLVSLTAHGKLLVVSEWKLLTLTPNCMYAEQQRLEKTLLKFYQSINHLLQKCRHCSAEKLWLLQRLDTDKYVYIHTQ